MTESRIGFIGAGNMATSLISGLLASGHTHDHLLAADQDEGQRQALRQKYAIEVLNSNIMLAERVDVLILAVKPQSLKSVCTELQQALPVNQSLIISVAAGIRIRQIERWLGHPAAIVRAMPNTPALIQCGASALYANAQVDPAQREQANRILMAAGMTVWLDHEEQMDMVTALSGSGPAYFFLFMEALMAAAAELGLPAAIARQLTLQTALGAARMAIEGNDELTTLRRKVTSPGGTTERGIQAMEAAGIHSLARATLLAAHQRAIELSQQFEEA
jgi:pyrroline-5-carboxylate reductase